MNGKKIDKQPNLSIEEAKQLAGAFNKSPGMQRLRKLFAETPPPWSKVRDMPPEGP